MNRSTAIAVTAVSVVWFAVATCAPAVSADAAFARWLESIWPEAQQIGVSRKTFDMAMRSVEPDLSLPDLDLPGRKEPPRGQAEFVQTPADYIKEANIASLGPGKETCQRSPRCARGHRTEIWRTGPCPARDLGSRDRLWRLQAAEERCHGAGDASLLWQAQGYVSR